MSDRLSKSDWIDHGLITLAREGPASLKVGPLAAALEVSRGSFYWHFRDLADFRDQVLQSWRERSTERVIDDMDAREGQPDRFKRLMRGAFDGKRSLDRAIRTWASHDEAVAAVVAEVDALRVGYIAKLLVASGVEATRADSRAAFAYWAFLGQAIVMDPRHATITGEDLDEVSALLETP